MAVVTSNSVAAGRQEELQGRLIRQVGTAKFVAKTKLMTVTTNLETVVYATARLKSKFTAPAGESGATNGVYMIYTSGVVSSNTLTFRRLTAGTISAPTYWVELTGYP